MRGAVADGMRAVARAWVCGLLPALEGLDGDHAAAAAGARMLRCLWLFWLGVGSLDGIDRDEWHCEQLTGACNVAGSGGIVEQAVMADAVEPLRQDMHEEAADELVGVECHHLVSLGTFETVILPFEGDAFVVECDEASVGNGDTVGVARKVAQHFLGSPEWTFAVDHPFAIAQGGQISREGLCIRQQCVLAEEL